MLYRCLIFIIVFSGCASSLPLENPIARQNDQCLKALVNLDQFEPSSFYLENTSLFFEGEMYQGLTEVKEKLLSFSEEQKRFLVLDTIQFIEHDSTHIFDLGYYKGWQKKDYAYLIAWNKTEGKWKKEFETIHSFDKSAISSFDEKEIDAARKLWVERSNSLDHRGLIENSYTSDAIYVNNGKVYKGTEEIVNRYSYMSQANWHIDLTGIKTFAVQENLVYEVGQYKSNGVGHYIILWEREESGTWKVALDFNF